MLYIKQHEEHHIIAPDIEMIITWKSFLGLNYSWLIRIYRDGVRTY